MMVPLSSGFLALPSVYQMAFVFCHFSLAFVYFSKDVCPEVYAHGLTSSACTSNFRKGRRKGWYGEYELQDFWGNFAVNAWPPIASEASRSLVDSRSSFTYCRPASLLTMKPSLVTSVVAPVCSPKVRFLEPELLFRYSEQ